MGYIKLKVKQGEEKSVGFTIKQNGEAMDLTDYIVHFHVKKTPVATSKPIVDKYITTSTFDSIYNINGLKVQIPSDINEAGQITDATNGIFQVHLNEEDTSYPTGDYYLIISLEQYVDKKDKEGNTLIDDDGHVIKTVSYCDIISSECCNSAKYIICEQ